MSKYLKIVVAALAVVALAAPAFADSTVSGYFRNQFITDNLGVTASAFTNQSGAVVDKDGASQIDQRLRLLYKNTLNEYVYFVYFAEIDTLWGQKSKGAIGGGGEASADGVNIETKNVYLDFKIPNSIFSVRTGIQGVSDRFDGTFINDDWAALAVNHQFAPNFNVTTIYSKGNEGLTTAWDDRDLYIVQTNFKLGAAAKLMVDGYYMDNNQTSQDDQLYMFGVAGDVKAGPATISAWVAAQFGDNGSDDYTGLAATAKAKFKAGPADIGARLTWFDSADSGDRPWTGGIGVYEFPGENLSIFFADKFYNNTNGGRRAMTDAVYQGNGLLALNATADFKLPANLYVNTGLGYFLAMEENGKEDKDLGLEIAARVGTKIAEKVDVSLGGAYAFLGDFYKSGSSDPDDFYKVNFMVNVGF